MSDPPPPLWVRGLMLLITSVVVLLAIAAILRGQDEW